MSATPTVSSERMEPDAMRPLFDAADPEIERMRSQFGTDGFICVSLAADPNYAALCAAVSEDQQHYADAGFNKVQDAWRRSAAIRTLAGLPAVKTVLEQLYAARPFPFQTLSFHRSSQESAFADTVHFSAEPAEFMCGAMFALEDFTPESGLPYFYIGSHKEAPLVPLAAGAPPGIDFREAYDRYYRPAILARAERSYERRPVALKKGEAVIWAGNITRGSLPIVADVSQRSLVVSYFFEGCDYYTPLNSPPGRRWRRLPSDASTGSFVWPTGGLPSLRTIAFECWTRLVNRVFPQSTGGS